MNKEEIKEMMENCIKDFAENPFYANADNTLYYLFGKMPRNDNFEEILVKITVLNSLYSTCIPNKDLQSIATLIFRNKEIDDLLCKNSMEVVDYIGQTEPGMNNAYVFASKYCSFHKRDKYIIFDSRSWLAMKTIGEELKLENALKEKNPSMDFEHYKKYCKCIIEFRDKIQTDHDYKEIDEFLWLYGKKLMENK